MSGKVFVVLSILGISHAIPIWLDTQVPSSLIINRNAAVLPNIVYPVYTRPYEIQFASPQYSSAVSSASNYGQSGLALSQVQANKGYEQALASAQNNNPGLWSAQTASSAAQSQNWNLQESALSNAYSSGLGFGSAISEANNAPGYQSAISLANRQTGPFNYGTAIAAAQNNGAYKSSSAHAVQQNGNLYQHSGANSINAPGLQAASAHAIQTGN